MENPLAWVKHLPEGERTQFWQELYTQLDATHSSLSAPTWVDYGMETEQLLISWKATADVHADPELLEILSTPLEEGDLVEAPRPEVSEPHVPVYAKHSIIRRTNVEGGRRRYRVMGRMNGHYILRGMSLNGDPERVLWAFEACEEQTKLDFVDNKFKVGIIEDVKDDPARLLSHFDLLRMGLVVDDL